MSRLFEWGIDMSRPQCRELFVPRRNFDWSETKKKRNITKWYSRRVSFWNDCGELIQEWLNGTMDPVDSVDLPFCAMRVK